MSITLQIDGLRDEVAPLYLKYDREINPQSAHVEIDEDGEVTAESNGEIGNAVPMFVWQNRTIRIGVSPYVVGAALADYLESEEGRAVLERIHAGHDVEWDGSNHVGALDEDAEAARLELESDLQELNLATIYTAAEWIEHDALTNVWPKGKTLGEAAEAASVPNEANEVIDGDMGAAIFSKAALQWYPSDAAKAGRWDIARALAEAEGEWCEADADDLADAVEALWPTPMACLDGFDYEARREVVANRSQKAEAEATLKEGLRWIAEDRETEKIDLTWLPNDVRQVLIGRRIDALEKWAEENPNTDDYDLYDSDRAERVTAEDLEIDEVVYNALVLESLTKAGAEGHVLAPNGRRVYAQA